MFFGKTFSSGRTWPFFIWNLWVIKYERLKLFFNSKKVYLCLLLKKGFYASLILGSFVSVFDLPEAVYAHFSSLNCKIWVKERMKNEKRLQWLWSNIFTSSRDFTLSAEYIFHRFFSYYSFRFIAFVSSFEKNDSGCVQNASVLLNARPQNFRCAPANSDLSNISYEEIEQITPSNPCRTFTSSNSSKNDFPKCEKCNSSRWNSFKFLNPRGESDQ